MDPKLFTSEQVKKKFSKFNKIKKIDLNLVDNIFNKYHYKSNPFFSLDKSITGESHLSKIQKITKIIKKLKGERYVL